MVCLLFLHDPINRDDRRKLLPNNERQCSRRQSWNPSYFEASVGRRLGFVKGGREEVRRATVMAGLSMYVFGDR